MNRLTGIRIAVRLLMFGAMMLGFFFLNGMFGLITCSSVPPTISSSCPAINVIVNPKQRVSTEAFESFCGKTVNLKGRYIRMINSNDVVFAQSHHGVTKIHMNDNKIIYSREPLKRFYEKLIDCNEFVKARTHILNGGYVDEIIKKEGSYIVRMHGGASIPISWKIKRAMKNLINDLSNCIG